MVGVDLLINVESFLLFSTYMYSSAVGCFGTLLMVGNEESYVVYVVLLFFTNAVLIGVVRMEKYHTS